MWIILLCTSLGAGGSVAWLSRRRRKHPCENCEQTLKPSTSGSDDEREDPGPSGDSIERSFRIPAKALKIAAASAIVITALGCGAVVAVRSRDKARRSGSGRSGHLQIPLRDLVRFREEQWFLEELENARDGDPNAMLRLAKMYLYGQGCDRSVNIAHEWLRRARVGGVYCTLDELLTAEDLDNIRRETRRNNTDKLHRQQPSGLQTSRH